LEPAAAPALPPAAWVKIAVLGALFALLNRWQFSILAEKYTDANWSHGYIIPLFSLYLLYVRRDMILAAPRKASLGGLAIFLGGLVGMALGVFPISNNWFSQICMVGALFGLVAWLAGWKVMRVVWMPVAYLILAMPLPDAVYEKIALPLQGLAASTAGQLLKLFGVNITVDALHMEIWSISGQKHELTVAEACSGIRSMMAFVALAVAWAYITDRPWWHRLVLVLAGFPVLIACNILRVSLTGTMFVIDQPGLGQDAMHELMGMILLIPALLLLMLLSKFLSSLFIEVEEEEPSPSPANEQASSAGNQEAIAPSEAPRRKGSQS
jgi:exosortase